VMGGTRGAQGGQGRQSFGESREGKEEQNSL
jgi:hypothetical protein